MKRNAEGPAIGNPLCKRRATPPGWLMCSLLCTTLAGPALAAGGVAESVLGAYDIDDIDAEWEQNTGAAVGSERLHGCFTTPNAKLYYFRISAASQLEQLVEVDTSTQPIRVNTTCSIGVGRASAESWGRPVIAYWRQYDTGAGDAVYFQRDTAASAGGNAVFTGNTGGATIYWPQLEEHPSLVLTGLGNGQIQQALPRKYVVPPSTDERGLVLRRCQPANGTGGCTPVANTEEAWFADSTVHSVAIAARIPDVSAWGGCANALAGQQCVHVAYELTSPDDLVNSVVGFKSRLIGATDGAWSSQVTRNRFAPVNPEGPISIDSDGVEVWIATLLPNASNRWFPRAYRRSSLGWDDFDVATAAPSGTSIVGAWPTVHLLDGVPTVTYWDEYNGARYLAKHDAGLPGCPGPNSADTRCWKRLYKLIDAPTARYEKRHATARHPSSDVVAFLSGIRRNGSGATDRPMMFTLREDQLGCGIMRSPPANYSYSAPKIVGDGPRWIAVYRRTQTVWPFASSLRVVRWAPDLNPDGSAWETTDHEVAGELVNVEAFDAAWNGEQVTITYRTATGDVKLAVRRHDAPATDLVSPHASVRSGAAASTAVAVAAKSNGDAIAAYRTSEAFGIDRLYTREWYASTGSLGPERQVESGSAGTSAPSMTAFDVAVDDAGALRVATVKVGTSRSLVTRTCTFPCAAWSAATTLGVAATEQWMADRLEVVLSPLGGGRAAVVGGVEYSTDFSAGKLVAHETSNGTTFNATPRVLDAPASSTYPYLRNGGHGAGAAYNARGELRAASVNLTDAQIRYVRDFPGNGTSSVHVRSLDVPTLVTSDAIRFSTDVNGEGFPVIGWSDDLHRLRSICEPTVY